jgi:hypothetical protein
MKAVAVGAWFAAVCYAQSDSISFGGVELRLGMAKAEVFTKLGGAYNLSKLKGPNEQMDMWVLTPKNGNDDEGAVQFWGEKLSNVSRTLGRMDGSAPVGVLGELFYAFQRRATVKMPAEDSAGDWKFTHTEVGTRDIPVHRGGESLEWRLRTISFHLGASLLDIMIWEPIGSSEGRSPSVEILEHIDDVGGPKRATAPK